MGTIALNKLPIQEYSLEALRRSVCYVPQEPILFSGSIRENLLVAKGSASDVVLQEVLDAAQLTRTIERLPHGIDTVLGADAAGLSGGERQRLALARALLLDFSVLVLDECTSAVDLPTERALFRAVAARCSNASLLIISHRLKSLMWVDRIILLKNGSIEAAAPHSVLYQTSPTYRQLFEAQDVEETGISSSEIVPDISGSHLFQILQ
jgi:ABC-type multidrug transport system fused ATPase/permease subunit